jgi:hypothetical protein
MDRDIATKMIAAGDRATEALNDILLMGESVLTLDESHAMKLAVGTILVSVQMDVLRAVYAQYPDLDRFGYFHRPGGES